MHAVRYDFSDGYRYNNLEGKHMDRILVTGGAGVFGRHLVTRLQAAGYPVRIMSRGPRPANTPAAVDWVTADLRRADGLAEAVAGAPIIVHAASSPARDTRAVDVDGTERLAAAAKAAGCAHFVYMSIVGIERVPDKYYQAKLAAEGVVQASGLPWSILRATQFHNLVHGLLQRWMDWPLLMLPTDWQIQPVHPGEVAQYLVDHLATGIHGRLRDFGGPEVLTLGQLIAQWAAVRGRGPRVWRLPLPGAYSAAICAGWLTAPERARGKVTWGQWLRIGKERKDAAT